MNFSDKLNFTQEIGTMSRAFNKRMAEDVVEAYFEALDDLDFNNVSRGIKLCIRRCKFLPKPAEIRDASREVQAATLKDQYEQLHRASENCATCAGVGRILTVDRGCMWARPCNKCDLGRNAQQYVTAHPSESKLSAQRMDPCNR